MWLNCDDLWVEGMAKELNEFLFYKEVL